MNITFVVWRKSNNPSLNTKRQYKPVIAHTLLTGVALPTSNYPIQRFPFSNGQHFPLCNWPSWDGIRLAMSRRL